MIDWIVNFIGKNAKPLAIMLVGLIFVNVCVQFYGHKTTGLTPWKGGGFGMYTTPHADGRTVWLEMDGENGIAQVRIYPENEDLRIWIDGVSLRGGTILQAISTGAEKLRFYPNDENTSALIQRVARIRWLDRITGGIIPKDGATFKPKDIRVLVYEMTQDMRAGTLTHQKVYMSSAGGV